jgi:hypothetical protein
MEESKAFIEIEMFLHRATEKGMLLSKHNVHARATWFPKSLIQATHLHDKCYMIRMPIWMAYSNKLFIPRNTSQNKK